MKPTLEDRLHRLESTEAIRTLKARYLACCDAKDPAGMRACFVDGPAAIDFGPVGQFDNADDLAAVYAQVACHEYMVEMHHGMNPRIELADENNARGEWTVYYQLINTQDMTLTQIGGEYDDAYRLTDGGWKISASRMWATSALVLDLGEDGVKRLLADHQPPAMAG